MIRVKVRELPWMTEHPCVGDVGELIKRRGNACCSLKAQYEIDGKLYCKRHAGALLIKLHLEDAVAGSI